MGLLKKKAIGDIILTEGAGTHLETILPNLSLIINDKIVEVRK